MYASRRLSLEMQHQKGQLSLHQEDFHSRHNIYWDSYLCIRETFIGDLTSTETVINASGRLSLETQNQNGQLCMLQEDFH